MNSLVSKWVWSHPQRSVHALLRFARTEAGGAIDIEKASEHFHGPLRKQMVIHADDEARHADLFRRRALGIARENGILVAAEDLGADFMACSVQGLSLTDHGLLPSSHIESLGKLEYMAMLHIAEQSAEKQFRKEAAVTKGIDSLTTKVFEEIIVDENFHVSYTKAFLLREAGEGRLSDLSKRERRLRCNRGRFLLSKFAGRIGHVVQVLMLSIIYGLLVLPFSFLAQAKDMAAGWHSCRVHGEGRIQ